ncbi:MAG: alpha/beta fold hydrolase [Acidimicrobiales bacterium]
MSLRHEIKGGAGLGLVAHEFGSPDGPAVLLIHGFTQSHLSWASQLDSTELDHCRLVALDIRGHGDSDKPLEPENYNDGKLWADDVEAVITQLGLDRPVIVGWSYGGFIINDYVEHHGDAKLGAINFVAAAAKLDDTYEHLGPGFLENAAAMTDSDLATQLEGIRRFLRACYATQPSQDDFETALAFNMVVPPAVRAGLAGRALNYERSMATISVPTLVTIGMQDTVVLPTMGDYITSQVPGAEASRYDDAGHVPFGEDPARFNSELATLVAKVNP